MCDIIRTYENNKNKKTKSPFATQTYLLVSSALWYYGANSKWAYGYGPTLRMAKISAELSYRRKLLKELYV